MATRVPKKKKKKRKGKKEKCISMCRIVTMQNFNTKSRLLFITCIISYDITNKYTQLCVQFPFCCRFPIERQFFKKKKKNYYLPRHKRQTVLFWNTIRLLPTLFNFHVPPWKLLFHSAARKQVISGNSSHRFIRCAGQNKYETSRSSRINKSRRQTLLKRVSRDGLRGGEKGEHRGEEIRGEF